MERIKLYPALKHGAYCSSSLLPGEDPVAFERLHKDLTEEFEPNGALEEDIVATITRLVWRKRHLTTFRNAQIAQDRWFTIQAEKRLQVQAEKRLYGEDVPELEMLRAAAAQVRKELGDTYDSVKLGKTPTFDHLLNELAVEERLDALIDKSLKRLVHVRGVKSLALSPSVAIPAQSSPVTDQTSVAPVIRRLSR